MSGEFGGFVVMGVLAMAMILATSFIMYEALRLSWRFMNRSSRRHGRILYALAAPFLVHIIAIWIYGVAYFVTIRYLPDLGVLISVSPQERLGSIDLLLSAYFSAATYTSLGFGDIVPVGHLRMIAGAEALNGLLLIGWSVTFSFLAMEEFWQRPPKSPGLR
jgi:hypothetical protein